MFLYGDKLELDIVSHNAQGNELIECLLYKKINENIQWNEYKEVYIMSYTMNKEIRSVNDELYGKGEIVSRNAYKYEGHYRRFIVKKELEHLLLNVGFSIVSSEERRGFAPFGEYDPPIIRIIARKTKI